MKLLLTSAGIKNRSINDALVGLLGQPIDESNALCIPTAGYGSRYGSPQGVVDFSIFPHLDHPDLPENTMADAERWAAEIEGQAYAIDDDTAIQVVDGTVEVVSERPLQTPAAVTTKSVAKPSRTPRRRSHMMRTGWPYLRLTANSSWTT